MVRAGQGDGNGGVWGTDGGDRLGVGSASARSVGGFCC